MPKNGEGIIQLLLPIIVLIVVIGIGVFIFASRSFNKPKTANETPGYVLKKSDVFEKSSIKKSSFEIISQPKLLFTGGYADPTIATLPDGKYVMYINNFTKMPSTYEAHTSTDGVNWTKMSAQLPNASTGRAVKFGNQIRLYYPGLTPIKPSDPPASVFSAISVDGLKFVNEAGTRVDPKSGYYLEGPTVFQISDGSYRMLFSENETASAEKRVSSIWGASSPDGLTWTRDSKVTLEADGKTEKLPNGQSDWLQALHPFVLKRPDGNYLMFYNTHSEVYAAQSTDGVSWTKLGSVGIHGADVDGYFEKDGSIRLYYGDFSPETKGVVYTVVIKTN